MYSRYNLLIKPCSRYHPVEVQKSWLSCPKCSLYFPSKDSLNSHLNSKHAEATNLFCKYCSLQYVSLSNFIKHSNFAHKTEITKDWNLCSNCNHHFPPGTDHKKVNCKPPLNIQCHFCPQSFDFTSTYSYHANSVHSDLIKGSWKECEKCGKYFPTEKDLQKHFQLIHKKCDVCDKTLDNKTTMIEHFNKDHSDMIPTDWKSCSKCKAWSLPDEFELDEHLKKCQAIKTGIDRCFFASHYKALMIIWMIWNSIIVIN